MSLRFIDGFSFREVNDEARVKKFGEVFTPLKFVESMLDMLNESDFTDPNLKIVEPTCGDGAFLVPSSCRLYLAKLGAADQAGARRIAFGRRLQAMALTINGVFGFELLLDNAEDCRANLLRLVITEIPELVDPLTSEQKTRASQFLAYAIAAISHQVSVRDTRKLPITKALLTSFEELPKAEKENARTKALEAIAALPHQLDNQNTTFPFITKVLAVERRSRTRK